MEIRVLGPFELVGDDGQLVDVGGHLPQALLVALALAEGRPVPADQLLDQVWPGEGLGDRNRLQVHISRLRKVLGSDRILTRAGGYSLQIPASALDAARFGQLAASGRTALRRQDPAGAGRLLRQALGLWRGRPLAEFADTGFAPGVITRLEEARLTTTEDRIDAELMLGGQGELTGELEDLVCEHPLRERLWGQLILALYRAGRKVTRWGRTSGPGLSWPTSSASTRDQSCDSWRPRCLVRTRRWMRPPPFRLRPTSTGPAICRRHHQRSSDAPQSSLLSPRCCRPAAW